MTTLAPAAQVVAAVNALGINSRDALAAGEMDVIVYLLDNAGAGLGYRFEWERFGPFSESLAADLVDLANASPETVAPLPANLAVAVERVRPLVVNPAPGVPELTWIRLLASVHFLQHFAGLPVVNGDRPAYLRNNFEDAAIAAAKARIADLDEAAGGVPSP